jgi:hypothetical protein
MQQISCNWTSFRKRVWPFLWFGFLALFVAGANFSIWTQHRFEPGFVIVPAILAAAGYVGLKLLVWDLVDEVLDDGDALVVRNHTLVDRIELSNISNVRFTGLTNPNRVTLDLHEPSKFGTQITFCPRWCLYWPPYHPIVTDLTKRVKAAR